MSLPVLAAVSSHADLRGKQGTFIYDMTACRELVLVTEPDGSESSAYMPDAPEAVAPDQSTIAALSRKVSRMLGKGGYCLSCWAKFVVLHRGVCFILLGFNSWIWQGRV